MSPEAKSESFLIRMGPTEIRMLTELADHTGLNRSDVVRQLIRREHCNLLGDAQKKPKKR